MNNFQMLNHYGFQTEFAGPQNLIVPSSQRCGLAGPRGYVPSGRYAGPVGALHGLQGAGPTARDMDIYHVGLATGLGSTARKVCSGAAVTGDLVGMIGGALADEDDRDAWDLTSSVSQRAGDTICDAGRRTEGDTPQMSFTLPGATSGSPPPPKPAFNKDLLLIGGGLAAVVLLVVLAKK